MTHNKKTRGRPRKVAPKQTAAAKRRKLFARYEQASQRVERAEQALEAARQARSRTVHRLAQQLGYGPFQHRGAVVRVTSRKRQGEQFYFLREEKIQ